jgi:hypothetical protein
MAMFFYITDGYVVYPKFIEDTAHIVSKPSLGENEKTPGYDIIYLN